MVVLIGEPVRDTLRGSIEADVLVGLGGDDYLFGFNGLDTLGLDGSDILMGNQGIDLIVGEGGDDIVSGGPGNDLIAGNQGNDALNGGTGSDIMQGGSGNDRYVVDRNMVLDRDSVEEDNDIDSNDLVATYVDNYRLPDRIENLTLLGAAARFGWGNDSPNRIVGTTGGNFLVGRRELDFSGMHRGDADTFLGQDGDDVYIFDSPGDRVTELPNQGTDVIVTDNLFNLLPDNVENLVVATRFIPLTTISGFGNELNNEISGGAADNWLFGQAGNDTLNGGSGGHDTLFGGDGNDQYQVFDPDRDIVRESNPDFSPTNGIDEVLSFTSDYTLPDRVENLILRASAFNGTGNNLANSIQGNQFDNSLDGGGNDDTLVGGQGNDTLEGGIGDDTYLFHLGDGVDKITGNDLADTVRFDDEAIGKDQVAFYLKPSYQLEIGYTDNDTDLITTPAFLFGSLVNRFELQDGLFMNSADLTRLQGILTSVASAHNISFSSLQDVKDSQELRDIIAESWRVGPDAPFNALPPVFPPVVVARNAGESLRGTPFGDILIGGRGTNSINALGGDDYVMGRDGIDILVGGENNDTLSGGNGNDFIFGESGFDILNGGVGNDQMDGGSGDDFYMVDSPRDVVIENPGGGFDTVVSSVDYAMLNSFGNTKNVEALRLIGSNDTTGTGTQVNDIIRGNDGNNTLDGKGGIDFLEGGKGNDKYIVDNIQDNVRELANQGDADRIDSTVDFTLPANVEILSLEGSDDISGTGNDLDNILLGNTGLNFLTGGDGNDILNGSPGDDALIGGTGDDRYVIFDDSGDTARELPGEGLDEVKTFVSYSLFNLPDVENLILGTTVGGGTLNNIEGIGNFENNFMEGNLGNNTLNGAFGDDTLIGAQGNDILRGEAQNDTYQFRLGDGNDEVTDVGGVDDRIRFTNSIAQDSIIFFRNQNPDPQIPGDDGLQIGYVGSNDHILLTNQTADVTAIERFELQDGLFMDADDVNRIINAMAQYARDKGVSFTSLADVQNNADLLNIVNSGWHT